MTDPVIAHAPPLDRTRRLILEHLDASGPVPVGELPRRWPLTGHHVRIVVRQLAADGLVAVDRNGGRVPRVTVTPAGRLAAAEPSLHT